MYNVSKVTQKDQTGAVALIAEYIYRPDGLRHSKTITKDGASLTHTHIWDGANIIAEIGATGTITARYIRGLSLITREQDGACQYYFHNAHGDVVQRIDARGNLLKNYDYDAFGNEQNPVESDSNPFRYCGEYWDKETETLYLRNRSYNPSSGRFASEDPIRAGDHWYNYCANNPVNGIDPLGLDVYYFYDPYMFDNWAQGKYETGVIVAEDYKKILEDVYDTEVHMVSVRNFRDFKKGWNRMQKSDANVDAVIINMHGGPEGLGVWSVNHKSFSQFLTKDKLTELENKKEIDLLMFLSCESGRSGYQTPTISEEFLDQFNINVMVASDGSVFSSGNKKDNRMLGSATNGTYTGDGFKMYDSKTKSWKTLGWEFSAKGLFERVKKETDSWLSQHNKKRKKENQK